MKERKRNRMMNYDYSKDNLYFVTSCTKDRIHFFGEIANNTMHLNDLGEIATQQWQWMIDRYEYAISHAFVVMPNHIHAILEINGGAIVWDDREIVGEGRDLPLRLSMKIKSVSELMGAYKTTTSKQIHLSGYMDFAWQRSFHDHIIRNNEAFEKIKNYILTNPLRWNADSFNQQIEEAVK
jgi:REP element-mobilizing transposase RayT